MKNFIEFINESIKIGSGTQCTVYDIGDNKVEKIFDKIDDKLIEKALNNYEKLIGKDLKYIAKIYSVDKIKKSYIQEKLKSTKSTDYKDCIDFFVKIGIDEADILEFNVQEFFEELEYRTKKKKIKFSIKFENDLKKFRNLIVNVYKEGLKFDLYIDDFHDENFGIDSNGNIKMFDLFSNSGLKN